MKIVLLKDVPKVGKKWDIKNVSGGHALNLLIPKGLAEVATIKAEKRAEIAKSVMLAERKVQEDLLLKNLKSLEGVSIEFSSKANEKGHLFAGIHKAEIAEALKEVGEFEIPIVVQDKTAKIKIVVKAE